MGRNPPNVHLNPNCSTLWWNKNHPCLFQKRILHSNSTECPFPLFSKPSVAKQSCYWSVSAQLVWNAPSCKQLKKHAFFFLIRYNIFYSIRAERHGLLRLDFSENCSVWRLLGYLRSLIGISGGTVTCCRMRVVNERQWPPPPAETASDSGLCVGSQMPERSLKCAVIIPSFTVEKGKIGSNWI